MLLYRSTGATVKKSKVHSEDTLLIYISAVLVLGTLLLF